MALPTAIVTTDAAAAGDAGGIRPTRRDVLTTGLSMGLTAAGIAAALPRPAAAQAGAVTTTQIADRLFVIAGAGGNVVVRAGDGEQLLVDSGARESADALRAALDVLTGGGRVTALFNSHWHAEHTGGNASFGRDGATIVAHEKTRLHLATEYYLPDEDRYVPAQPADAWPVETIYTTGSMRFAGEAVDYGHLLQAHTDGDIYVYFRDANVIAVGDALAPVRDPELDWFGGGWLGGRADALALLLRISDAGTRFVPGFGPVVGRDYLEAEHALMLRLYDLVQEHVRRGMTAEDILAAGVMDGLPRTFDEPLAFLYAAHKGMWAHHNTLSHDIV